MEVSVEGPVTLIAVASRGAGRASGADNVRDLDAGQPYGHACGSEEVAAAVINLVSDANPYASGQELYSMARVEREIIGTFPSTTRGQQ